jgi:uncharacterized lipoprotein YmbA
MSRPTPWLGPLASAVRRALPLAVALALGCASSGPAVHLYTLMPAEIPARAGSAPSGTTAIGLEIHLPAQVDQPQLLVRLPDDSLVSLEQERWASPLRDEMRAALFEQLGAASRIVDARGAGGPTSLRVAIDVRRFDSIPGREARIEGSWVLVSGTAPGMTTRCDWLYREPAPGAVTALVEAHRRAIVHLADAIGTSVTTAGRGQAVGCPASDLR